MNALTTNNRTGNATLARSVQPELTAHTYNCNPRFLSTETETTQRKYNGYPPFDYRRNMVWRLEADTPIGRALNAAQCYFTSMGISNGRQEALTLLASVLEQKEYWLFTNHDYQLNIEQIEHYTALIRHRIAGEPLAELINV